MKKLILSALVMAIACTIYAQESSQLKKPSIAFKASLLDFKTTNRTEGLSKTSPAFGLQYFVGLKPRLDFMMNLDIASLKYPYYVSLQVPKATANQFYTGLDFNLNYKFGTDEKSVVPFITAGLGLGADQFSYYTAYAPLGGGLQIKAKHGSYVQIMSTYRAEASSLTKMYFSHSISYSLPLKGKPKKAIAIPPPAPVVVDTDNDGVNDAEDQCPNQIGTAKYKGCPIPDTDGDGINDELDKCPGNAGLAKYQGCPIPDSDKDGVNDELDKCPQTAGLTRYEGCPIPDTDGDGVNDEADKCPQIAGIAANNGCEDLQPIVDKAAANLKFAIGKIYLSKAQLVELDPVILALNNYPNARLAISGHTDITGPASVNIKLSIKRAAVVYQYFIKKGIDAARLSKEGFAATKPIADNKTKEGRKANRRTDLSIIY